MESIFGTDGIRARVGTSFLTQENLFILGRAIALWAQKKYHKEQPHVLITHDTRASYSWIKSCLKAGLLSYPITLYDAHILPTPAALVLMQEYQFLTMFDCAIIISASHNPYYDNGIKLMSHTGKLSAEDETEISKLYNEYHDHSQIDYRALGRSIIFDSADKLYCAKIAAHFKPNFLKGLKIVLDCAHGATYRTAPTIFKLLGAQVIAIHNKPTGYNINEQCGALQPAELQRAVLAHEADAGFAFDGDGDRITAVSRTGEIKDGDEILALLSEHPAYAATSAIVGTVVTNMGLENHLKKQKRSLIRTDVGDKHIIAQLNKKKLILGGEQSGHIILHDLLQTGDGVLAALRLLESISKNDNLDMKTFSRYPQELINVPAPYKLPLNDKPCAELIANAEAQLKNGRVLVRYSGTEPLLRVMVEAEKQADAKKIAQQLAHEFEEMLKAPNLKGPNYEKQNYRSKTL